MPTHIKGHNRSTISVSRYDLSCQYLMLRSTEFLQMNLPNFWPEKGASFLKIECIKGRVSNTIHAKNMLLLARAPPSTTWRASLLLRQRAKRGKESPSSLNEELLPRPWQHSILNWIDWSDLYKHGRCKWNILAWNVRQSTSSFNDQKRLPSLHLLTSKDYL